MGTEIYDDFSLGEVIYHCQILIVEELNATCQGTQSKPVHWNVSILAYSTLSYIMNEILWLASTPSVLQKLLVQNSDKPCSHCSV